MKIREAFSKEEELQFLEKERVFNPPYIRWMFLLFIVLYAFFALTDFIFYPDEWQTLFIIRFAIVIPLLILVILLSYKQSLSKFHQYYIAFSFFVGGAGIAYMLILYPENIVYYGGLFLVYFSGYLLIRLRFYYATFSGLAILSFHIIGHIIINKELSETVLFGMLFFIGANLIGMVGAYQLEVKNRKQFIYDRDINQKNSELIQQYKEKDEQFNNLVESIKENKELIAKNETLDLLTKSLKESEQRFRVTVQSLDDGVVIHAPDSSIIDFNKRALEILGLSGDQLLGKTAIDPIWKFVDESEKPLLQGEYPANRILANKKPINRLTMGIVQSANKEIVWVQVNGIPIFDQNGQLKEVVISFFDITELKKTYKRVQESEYKFRKLFEQAPFGYQSLDASGNFIEVNEKWLEIMGYQKEEVIGKWFGDFLVPEMKEPFKKRFEMFKERGNVHTEFSMKTKNGDIIFVGFDGNVSYDEAHVFIQTHCTVTDITEITIATNKLKQRNALIEGLFNHMTSGVAIYEVINDGLCGSDYIIKDFNETSLGWENKSRGEVVGKALSELHPNIDDSGIIDFFRKVWKTGKPIIFPARQYVNGNYNRWHDNRIFKLPSGEIVAMYDDVTDRVEKENELKQERKDLLISQSMAKLGTWRLDIKTNNVIWSEELYKMYGFDSTLPPPPYTEHMELFTRPSWEMLSSALALTASEGTPYELVLETITQDGTNGWMWVRGEAECDNQGKIVSIYGAAQDITYTKQQEAEIIHAGNHDYLTEIPNRRYYQEMLKRYDNEAFYPLGIIIMDMNGLKLINDAFGHNIGNEALKICANTLNETKREKDFLARLGGDEFAIICPNIKVTEMEKLVDRIDKEVSEKSIKDIELSLAIGYEIKQNKKESIQTTLTNSENNMYRKKVLTKHTDKNDMIQSILNTLTEKYNEEKVHSNRVSKYCKAIGEVMQLRKDEIIELELAGMVHDIGKISLPDAILKKPGKLTKKEWEIIKNHTTNGYQILRAADKYSNIAEFAMSHHERMDGKGYPNGITGEEIPLFSRIISVADAYEAMTSDRPYRKAMMKEVAIKELEKHAGSQFDPKIVDLFITQVLLVETT